MIKPNTWALCLLCVKVKSRGQVVSAGKSPANVTLLPEFSWAPLAHVLVYCVRPSGEIVNNVMQLPVAQTFQNKVKGRSLTTGLGSAVGG